MDERPEKGWAELVDTNDGVFGSIPQSLDGRTRSTSGSTIHRSGGGGGSGTGGTASTSDFSSTATYPVDGRNTAAGMVDMAYSNSSTGGTPPHAGYFYDDCIFKLSNCNESSEPDKVDRCLSNIFAFLDRLAGGRELNTPVSQAYFPDEVVHSLSQTAPTFLAHYEWHIRARTYKLLRRLPSPQPLMYCKEYLELSTMRTFALDDTCHEEREQALKFIRWTMRFHGDYWLLTPPVIKAIMVISEQADDKMRNICLETLCETLVVAPERLWYVNGIRSLTQCALDGPWSISISIASALTHIMDSLETRKYVHLGMALGGIASALTESLGKEQMMTERAKIAAFMLTQLLKSWSGVQYFLSDGRKVIKALVDALYMIDSNRKIILGMLLELFGLSDDFDMVKFEQQPRFDVDLLSPFQLPAFAITDTSARTRLLPVDYLRTILLMIFIDEGLVESLVSVALESKQPEVVDASATLIKWLSQHPHMPLPEKYVVRFQTLGELVDSALAQSGDRSITANQIICKIEGIPSLSMGQLPSQQLDSWATSLTSSVFYRHYLKRRRFQQQAKSQGSSHTRSSSQTIRADSHDSSQPVPDTQTSILGYFSSAGGLMSKGVGMIPTSSTIGSSKGLAATIKDNATHALRSSASTGNLKAAATATGGGGGGGVSTGGGSIASGIVSAIPLTNHNPIMPLLTTVNEDSVGLTLKSATVERSDSHANADMRSDVTSLRGRRSLDISSYTLHTPQPLTAGAVPQMGTPHGMFANANNISALVSPYTQFDSSANGPISSMYSHNAGSTTSLLGTGGDATAPASASAINTSINSAGLSASIPSTPMTAVLGPTPPLLSRARTKSRSRARNSFIVNSNLSLDEALVSKLIQESRVTTEDNPMRWDWATIRVLINGPIGSSRRVQEVVTTSGFLPRLSHFFRPSSLEFCDLSRTASNEEYLEMGRQLIRILISSADGLLLIDESRLLSGIVDEIKKQNSYARKTGREESCFSFARLQMTMSPGYFHFLNEIAHSVGGDSLLERNRLFDAYYQIVELPDQGLLIQYILSSMDYSAEGHARNILRKVAASSYESLRQLAPGFLLYLTSDTPCRPGSVTAWAIEILTSLIYDASPVVRSTAAQCLVLAIDIARENPYLDRHESEFRLAHLLDLHPMFDLAVINDIRPLILRIIATEHGFAYLKNQGVVDTEMSAWGALEGILYVRFIELEVARALAFGPLFSGTADGMMLMTTSLQTPPTPAHLFGELAKSASGRAFLLEYGIPGLLFETLANIPWNSTLPDDVVGLKATLWAIGAVGASQDGYLLLEPFDAIDKLTEIATEATSLSIKGTCLYALALLSRSGFAAEAFRERGWQLCSSCYGTYEFAVPKKLESILNAGGWADGGILQGTYVFSEGPFKEPDVTEDLDSVQKEIVEAVILMSNHVMMNAASRTLMRLRMSHPHYFRLLPLYRKVMHLVGKYRYRLSTRRFIYDVFDVNLASLHEQMAEAAAKQHMQQLQQHQYHEQGVGGGAVGRRFSSSSQRFYRSDTETQRKRASTLQENSSSPSTTSVFPRRQTNGLLDDIRPLSRRQSTHQSAATSNSRRAPATPRPGSKSRRDSESSTGADAALN